MHEKTCVIPILKHLPKQSLVPETATVVSVSQVMRGSRGGTGVWTPLLIGFLSNTGLDPLKNHNATKRAFNIGPSSARQRTFIHQSAIVYIITIVYVFPG